MFSATSTGQESESMKLAARDRALRRYLTDYQYQPDLTERLDAAAAMPTSQQRINEIVLWKVNRFVALAPELLKRLDGMRALLPGGHRASECASLLEDLLAVSRRGRGDGIDIPSVRSC
jgi:hypothetical protein